MQIICRIFLALLTIILIRISANAARCYGDADCHACHTCGYCAHCNEPGQTQFCGVYLATHESVPKAKIQNKKSVHQSVTRKKYPVY